MIENDFPILRESVRESAIGRSVAWLATAITSAAADAAFTRGLVAVRSIVEADAATTVRMSAIAVAVATIAAWGLSRFVPPYVATAIPGAAYFAVAVLSALAAVRAEALAEQWRSSRLRRLMT